MSEILAREGLDAVKTWAPPDVRRAASASPAAPRHPSIYSARELERVQKQAWDEAYAAGHKVGIERGLTEGRDKIQREVAALKAALDRFAGLLDAAEAELNHELTELALAIARAVIGREVSTAPEFILALVPEAVKALPAHPATARVHMNPADAALLREHLPDGDGEVSWTIVEDATLSRGGCRIDKPSSSADLRLETRLAAVVARLFAVDEEPDAAPDTPWEL